MALRFAFAALVALFAADLSAQGMSEDYVRERTRAKYASPHGLTFDIDLLAQGSYFSQWQRVRADGLTGDQIDYEDDMGGSPIGVFLDLELRLRFSWNDSISASYGFRVLRAFDDTLDEATAFNGVSYPKGVDADYGSDWHDLALVYRRDLFRIGLANSFTVFVQAGLEWGIVSTQFGSDTFAVTQNRDVEKFKELLPWYTVGLGLEWQIGDSVLLTAQGRGTYEVGVPTFQRRDENQMKQSVISINASFTIDWQITEWFSLLFKGHYRQMKLKLYGGFRADEYEFTGFGPEFGLGFRF